MSTAYSFVGSQHCWFGVLDSLSYLMGTTGTIANGSDAGMGRLNGVNTVGLTIPEARNIVYEGDNGTKGSQLISPSTMPEGEIVTSIADLTFQTQAQSLTTRTLGDTVSQMLGPRCPTYKTLALIVNSPGLDQTAGNVGQSGWHTYIFWKTQIQPRSGTIENGSPSAFSHKTVATYADTAWWGEAFPSSSGWGTLSGLILDLGWGSAPWTGHTFISNAATLTFTLDETPTAANGNALMIWKNGVLLTYTTDYTVVPSTKTVTLVAAGTAGDKFECLYRYVPTC